MASVSLRSPASRTATPKLPSPYPKQIISLEDWEAKAPLSDNELKSITALQNSLKDKSLLIEVSQLTYCLHMYGLKLGQGPAVGVVQTRLGSPTPTTPGDGTERPRRSETPVATNGISHRHERSIQPSQPVQTTQEFYEWFSLIERSVAHSQEAHYRDYLSTLDRHLGTCEDLMEGVSTVSSDVDSMLDGWRSVEAGGRSMKEACEELLDERVR